MTRGHLYHELCRGFHAKPVALECALRHGQVSIDGYVIRMEHINRWPRERLVGRYARLHRRVFQLYGSTPVER